MASTPATSPMRRRLPSRRMPTVVHVFSTSLRTCDDRKTVRPSLRASSTIRSNSCWLSGSRPLVGSSRIKRRGRGVEGLDQHDLALVAGRVLAELAAGVELETLGELLEVGLIHTAA